MGFLVGALCIILFSVFLVQIGKARELASTVYNDKSEEYAINTFQAGFGMVFMIVFLLGCIASFVYYMPYILGWGPYTAASEHGPVVDRLFNVTLLITAIVFFITQFALFYFAWKYRGRKGSKGIYWAHNEKLEMVWMIVPSVVMTFLVIGGLQAWNQIMIDLPDDHKSVVLPSSENEHIEIEATGTQFLWILRYPGRDGKLGIRDFTKIDGGTNPLGQVWSDPNNIDDFHPDKIVLPVGKKVRVRITARDVLHNFYIRDFRVKMDAVPGMPTYFIFTPTVTTDSMRRRLKERPEWQVADKNDPNKQRWETFDYELACAELCGRGHYSMRRIVKIVSDEEYLAWIDAQEGGSLSAEGQVEGVKTQYFANIKGTAADVLASSEEMKNYEGIMAAKVKANAKIEAAAKDVSIMAQVQVPLKALRLATTAADAEKAFSEIDRITAGYSTVETPVMDTTAVADTTAVEIDTTAAPTPH
ncbi:MAG: cytochrome c oxidase subunit II [Aureispira sp.]|nr:cytochrome c oxidase subunit II [Aureispira sp.]